MSLSNALPTVRLAPQPEVCPTRRTGRNPQLADRAFDAVQFAGVLQKFLHSGRGATMVS